ncbi:hypothetical protein [Bacillus solitudinis]|uniref:hypothetical protein n=1 Tax=Bacillus solitudinis TaxID=2014074 RepID=UPI000C231DFA|nr:hypothetical protein [Bacillus solitudinis]
MGYESEILIVQHNGKEIEVEHKHSFRDNEFSQKTVSFNYEGVEIYNYTYHLYIYKQEDTANSFVKKLCTAIDYGGTDACFKFTKLYDDKNSILYNYILIGDNLYKHEVVNPLSRKKHILKVEFKNGKTVKNIPGLPQDVVYEDDKIIWDMTIGCYKKSLASIKRNSVEWHRKTGSLPKDKHLEEYQTGRLKEINEFFEEIGVNSKSNGGIE